MSLAPRVRTTAGVPGTSTRRPPMGGSLASGGSTVDSRPLCLGRTTVGRSWTGSLEALPPRRAAVAAVGLISRGVGRSPVSTSPFSLFAVGSSFLPRCSFPFLPALVGGVTFELARDACAAGVLAAILASSRSISSGGRKRGLTTRPALLAAPASSSFSILLNKELPPLRATACSDKNASYSLVKDSSKSDPLFVGPDTESVFSSWPKRSNDSSRRRMSSIISSS